VVIPLAVRWLGRISTIKERWANGEIVSSSVTFAVKGEAVVKGAFGFDGHGSVRFSGSSDSQREMDDGVKRVAPVQTLQSTDANKIRKHLNPTKHQSDPSVM
jgi:hypothetical protein